MDKALFLIFAAIAVIGAANLLRQRHPIYSALSLVAVMGALAALYLLLGAEFIAAVQVIVYAGAIMVLFIFTLMLLNVEEEAPTGRSRMARFLGLPLLFLLLLQMTAMLRREYPANMVAQAASQRAAEDNVKQVGDLLFNQYVLPFEVTSVLILVAIMGAVVLARRKS
jgi:NADH-quinone oxidoreductase subunit J